MNSMAYSSSEPASDEDATHDDKSSESVSDRLRRERTQRHRQRLQRVKQFQQANSHVAPPSESVVQAARPPSPSSESSLGSSVTSSASVIRSRAVKTQPLSQTTLDPKQPLTSHTMSQRKLTPAASQSEAAVSQSPTRQGPATASLTSTSTSAAASSKAKPLVLVNTPPPPPTNKSGPVLVSVESPLPPLVQRSLGDRSYDKRKNAALEIEQLVKSLSDAHNLPMIHSIINVLAKDFCTSMNANYRKGGLIGIAATAIGLMGNTRQFLEGLIFPVLHCFDDPESRVRYYACESLYNIAKVARGSLLRYFNQIFDGLTKLFADVDGDVKNGANLLDRLVKDIVTESESFHVEHFLPLLQTYIRRTNPYIRQLLVGWITVLDSVPDISMIDYLPDFLEGLFNMLSDSNREIRQAADSALSDFLKEVRQSTVMEFGPLVPILVNQCVSKDRLNRLTAITWMEELIHHPHSGGDALLPHHAEVLGAILYCISDSEDPICVVAERTNADLLSFVRDTQGEFRIAPLLDTLTEKIMTKEDVPTKMASLRWINMLLEKRRKDMTEFIPQLMPVLLKTLSDASDAVVLLTLQMLARISLGDGGSRIDGGDTGKKEEKKEEKESNDNIHCGLLRGKKDEKHFKLVIDSILGLFASDRMLLENRGSLVIRKMCVLLDAESVYMLMAEVLSSSCESLLYNNAIDVDTMSEIDDKIPSTADHLSKHEDIRPIYSIEFISTMVQTLNLILLTAIELHGLRVLLAKAFDSKDNDIEEINISSPGDEHSGTRNGVQVFESLFRCWCHSPVATFSLCLLAHAYDEAFALVKKFSELDVTVGFLMQIDKLVQLLESPVFVHLRLQLLEVESPHHASLLKCCYGLLMLLPQSDAFRSLNDRLTTVCNLRDNLGVPPTQASQSTSSSKLLSQFDVVMDFHRRMRGRETNQGMTVELLHEGVKRGNGDLLDGMGKVVSRVKQIGAGGSSPAETVVNLGTSSSIFLSGSEQGGTLIAGTLGQRNGRITQEV